MDISPLVKRARLWHFGPNRLPEGCLTMPQPASPASLSLPRPTLPWRKLGWGLAGLVLLLPLAAMQFTGEVNWGLGDFAAAAALLGLTGLAIEGAVRIARTPALRIALVLAAIAMLLLVWAELAVGIV
jgi:hypothetical protein